MQPRRHHRLGLTLLEVLAATVLLSIMALACIPLLRSAGALANSNPVTATPDLAIELRSFANAIVAHPDLMGCKDQQGLMDIEGTIELSWPDRADLGVTPPDGSIGSPLQFHVLRAPPPPSPSTPPGGEGGGAGDDKPIVDHAWMMLQCGGSRVVRWIKLPPLPHGEASS